MSASDLTAALEALERMEREATPGPWYRDGDELSFVGNPNAPDERYVEIMHLNFHSDGRRRGAADLEFCAAARNALPALLKLARLAIMADEVMNRCPECVAEIALSTPEKSMTARWHADFASISPTATPEQT